MAQNKHIITITYKASAQNKLISGFLLFHILSFTVTVDHLLHNNWYRNYM